MTEIKKVYVDENSKAAIICPHCGKATIVDASTYRTSAGNRNVNFDCLRCESEFTVFLDFRLYYRKTTSLKGLCYMADTNIYKKIIVENISKTGVGFTVDGLLRVKPDDLLDVQFNLDDEQNTFIRKRVVIRFIRENYIGAEFCESIKYYKEIGFYLKA